MNLSTATVRINLVWLTTSSSILPTTTATTLIVSPTKDDIIVGCCMFFCSILCIVPNIVVMLAIRKDKELYRLNAYRLMLFMLYFDIAQLVVHAITGIFNAFQSTFNHVFAKLLGAVATPSYITYAVMTIILSLNRLTQLCFPRLDKQIFSKKTMKFWYGLGLSFFIIFFIALASPFATIIYFPEYWSWDYDRENYPWSFYVQKVEMVIEIGGIPISGLIYFYVFCVLVSKASFIFTFSSGSFCFLEEKIHNNKKLSS